MPNNHTVVFLKMEEYKRNTFELLTDFLNKRRKLFSPHKYAQGRQCLLQKYCFCWEIIEKAVKSYPSVESIYELIMAMQRKILLCLVGTSHHCISLLLKGA